MNGLVLTQGSAPAVPALITAKGERASLRFLEFFTADIRNPHTRRAYASAADGRSLIRWFLGFLLSS
jgi:hypothetical protein